MWKQTKITVGTETADQAMVDFTGKLPEVLEWPTPLALNTEVKIGDETYFAGYVQACAGKFHIPLMREPLLPKDDAAAIIRALGPDKPASTAPKRGK